MNLKRKRLDSRHAEQHKRELAKLILEAALAKIEELGFVPMLRERDSLDRHSGRHHIMARRIEYLHIGTERH